MSEMNPAFDGPFPGRPEFRLVMFAPNRRAAGHPPALVNIHHTPVQASQVWMSADDLRAAIREYGLSLDLREIVFAFQTNRKVNNTRKQK